MPFLSPNQQCKLKKLFTQTTISVAIYKWNTASCSAQVFPAELTQGRGAGSLVSNCWWYWNQDTDGDEGCWREGCRLGSFSEHCELHTASGTILQGRKSRGTKRTKNSKWGGDNANCVPQILSCFKISNSRLLAVLQWCSKSLYPPHNSNRVFTISKKQIFNIHQIITSGRKFNIFLAKTRTNKYRSECTKIHHFKWKIHFFSRQEA